MIAGEAEFDKLLSSVERLPKFNGEWKIHPDVPKALFHMIVVSYGECIHALCGVDMERNRSQSIFVYGTSSKS